MVDPTTPIYDDDSLLMETRDDDWFAPPPWRVEQDDTYAHVMDAEGALVCSIPLGRDLPLDESENSSFYRPHDGVALARRIRMLPEIAEALWRLCEEELTSEQQAIVLKRARELEAEFTDTPRLPSEIKGEEEPDAP